MPSFNASKDSLPKSQMPRQPSRASQVEAKKLEKSEADHAQIIKDEAIKRRPNLSTVQTSSESIFSQDILRDLQGINAKPDVLAIIEKRIEVLSTLQRK